MRTRDRGKRTKKYSETADLEEDEEAEQAQDPDGANTDDDFDVGDAAKDTGEDEFDIPEEEDDDSDHGVDGFAALDLGRKKQSRQRLPSADLSRITPSDPDRVSWLQYMGPLKRWSRGSVLGRDLYGGDLEGLRIIRDLDARWRDCHALPSKLPDPDLCTVPSPWVPPAFEDAQRTRLQAWLDGGGKVAGGSEDASSRLLPPDVGARYLPRCGDDLETFVGPRNQQTRFVFKAFSSVALAHSGAPLERADAPATECAGWMLDAGGIVLGLSWLPAEGMQDQVLALSAVPHADQAYFRTVADAPPEFRSSEGCIQLWSFRGSLDDDGVTWPSPRRPRLTQALCSDWGRVRRLEWCPVPCASETRWGVLAFLSADGFVRVVEVKRHPKSRQTIFGKIEHCIATLGIPSDPALACTCFTWVNINRVCLGHADGSLTLWSVRPFRLLQRHAVHPGPILSIRSAYPSHPLLIASKPVGGLQRLTDLSNPSIEATLASTPSYALHAAGNMLAWSEHLQGFVDAYPGPLLAPASVAFCHVAHFAHPRHLLDAPAGVPAVAADAGVHHPFLLVGCADGSLWAANMVARLLQLRGEKSYKLRLFQHDHAVLPPPPPPDDREAVGEGEEEGERKGQGESKRRPLRSAARILQGFVPKFNDHPRGLLVERNLAAKKQSQRKKVKAVKPKSGKRRGRPPKHRPAEEPAPPAPVEGEGDAAEGEGDGGEDGVGGEQGGEPAEAEPEAAEMDDLGDGENENEGLEDDDVDGVRRNGERAKRNLVFEPLTRITAVAWNPNADFSWWAAAAAASGLVRVMDLGVTY